jgi:hypothetical protein
MIKASGPIITVETPPDDGNAPVQGAGVQDIVARPGGGFMIVYRVSVMDDGISNSSTICTLRLMAPTTNRTAAASPSNPYCSRVSFSPAASPRPVATVP